MPLRIQIAGRSASMTRFVLSGVLVTLVGCDAPVGSPPAGDFQKISVDSSGGEEEQQGEPTPIVVTDTGLTFDPKTCVRGQAGFGWGLGSVQVNVLGRDRGFCIFDYTNETEGGYTVYRCRVPVGGPNVKIFEDNGGIVTSFSLKNAKVIRSGNLHLDFAKTATRSLQWQQHEVPDTGYVNYFTDLVVGTGVAAEQGNRVIIRYTVYADQHFAARLPGIEESRTLEFTLGDRQVGAGLETAVQGMKVGGKRRVLIREEVATMITEQLGGVQAETQLAVEVEVTVVE